MSFLSELTGIHVSKKGVRIEPKKALLTAVGVGIPALGMAGKLGGLVGKGAPGLGALGKLGGFLKGNAKTIADYGTLGEGIYDRHQENNAANFAQDRYRSLQPYRDKALAELSGPSAVTMDPNTIFNDPNAPTRYRRVGVGSGR